MIESVIILGKVVVVCGAGFGVATWFEWFNDMEVKPKNKTIQIGQEKKEKGDSSNEHKINNVSEKIRSKG